MPFLDISLPLTADLPAWPGSPTVRLEPVDRRARGDAANTSRLVLGSHSGTHVDAPRHFLDEGPGVDALPLDTLIGPCEVVEAGPDSPAGTNGGIGAAALQRSAGTPTPRRLLLKTSNSELWSRPAFTPDFVYLEPDAAEWLVASGVRLVGVDYLSIERFKRPGAPAHHILLRAGVVIVEGLNLAGVAPGSYELICLPLRLPGADGSPARVILRL